MSRDGSTLPRPISAADPDRQRSRDRDRQALRKQRERDRGQPPHARGDVHPSGVSGACCAANGSCGVPGGLPECGAQGGTYQGDGTSCTPNPCPLPLGACCLPSPTGQCTGSRRADLHRPGGNLPGCASVNAAIPGWCVPVVPTPFLDALPIPGAAHPVTGTSGGAATYDIAMREVQQQLHAELANPTTVWGYDDGRGASYPGPTIEASVGPDRSRSTGSTICATRRSPGAPLRTEPLPAGRHLPARRRPEPGRPRRSCTCTAPTSTPAFDGHPEATFPPGQPGHLRLSEQAAARDALVPRPRPRHHAAQRLHGPRRLLPDPRRLRERARSALRRVRDPARDPGPQLQPRRLASSIPPIWQDHLLRRHDARQRQGLALSST